CSTHGLSCSSPWSRRLRGCREITNLAGPNVLKATEDDLVAGAVALAYRYVDVAAIREALVARAGDEDGVRRLPDVLEASGAISPERAEKLKRATDLVRRLKDDAIYGTIALKNHLIGASMLNACMEESRR